MINPWSSEYQKNQQKSLEYDKRMFKMEEEVTQNDKVYFPVREMWDARKYRGPSSIRSTGEKIT